MLRILIVEDEEMVARRLRRLLERIFEAEKVKIWTQSTFGEAQWFLKKHTIDLLFLDLNLNGKDGFSLLAKAMVGAFETVVVSANTDRALEAFEHGVLDFVAKPFGETRLRKALGRFRNRSNDPPTQVLAIRLGSVVEWLCVDEVLAIHGADNYAEVETRDGRRLLHDKRLDHLEKVLPSRFLRIHRSHIVDCSEAVRLVVHRGSRYELELKSGLLLPVSRGRVAALRARLV